MSNCKANMNKQDSRVGYEAHAGADMDLTNINVMELKAFMFMTTSMGDLYVLRPLDLSVSVQSAIPGNRGGHANTAHWTSGLCLICGLEVSEEARATMVVTRKHRHMDSSRVNSELKPETWKRNYFLLVNTKQVSSWAQRWPDLIPEHIKLIRPNEKFPLVQDRDLGPMLSLHPLSHLNKWLNQQLNPCISTAYSGHQ